MDRLNSHFLHPPPTAPEASGGSQIALVVKFGVIRSRSHLLTGPHRCHPWIVQQAQGRSSETALSPHHNYQSTIYNKGTHSKRCQKCIDLRTALHT
jgi:hypothetical protein